MHYLYLAVFIKCLNNEIGHDVYNYNFLDPQIQYELNDVLRCVDLDIVFSRKKMDDIRHIINLYCERKTSLEEVINAYSDMNIELHELFNMEDE